MSDAATPFDKTPDPKTGQDPLPDSTSITYHVLAVADGEDVPVEVRAEIEGCPDKSALVEGERTCCGLMRGCLRRAMQPPAPLHAKLCGIVSGSTLERRRGRVLQMRGLPARVVAPLGAAAAVLLVVLVVFSQRQDAFALEAMNAFDDVRGGDVLEWRLSDGATTTDYQQVVINIRKCPRCRQFFAAIPEPATPVCCRFRLLGACNTLWLESHPTVTLLYAATGHGDWQFVLQAVQIERERIDAMTRARTVVRHEQPDGREQTYRLCEAGGRSCVAWYDDANRVAWLLTAADAEVPSHHSLLDVASAFRHADRFYSTSTVAPQ